MSILLGLDIVTVPVLYGSALGENLLLDSDAETVIEPTLYTLCE